MKIFMFYHSVLSDWNHGNAHFLRGIATELMAAGHEVAILESANAWSRLNLVREHGEAPLREFRRAYPHLNPIVYDDDIVLESAIEGADLVIVHEWNTHSLVKRIGQARSRNRGMRILFHDTHHRSVTDPGAMAAYDLKHYDGVLAFGEALRRIYAERSLARRAWTWHEAADTRVFKPLPGRPNEGDLAWVGNWGDEERTREVLEYLVGPVAALNIRCSVYGVRYPESVRLLLKENSIACSGWAPNFRVPRIFAAHRLTVHIPRRPYTTALPGIPTIRVFEALACGIPLVCSPWDDCEGLFAPGKDFLVAADGRRMAGHMKEILHEPGLAASLAAHGLRTIRERHNCARRAAELLEICRGLGLNVEAPGNKLSEVKSCRA